MNMFRRYIFQSTNQAAQDAPLSFPFNFSQDRGPSNQHRPQRFVTSYVWEIPGVHANGPAALRLLTRDWKVSGILTLQSGRPFNIAATGDPLAGIPGDRVNLIGAGNPVLAAGRSKGQRIDAYFDKTRFVNPNPNQIGSLGRNILEGPGFANFDVAMVKGFRIPFLGEAGL